MSHADGNRVGIKVGTKDMVVEQMSEGEWERGKERGEVDTGSEQKEKGI